MHITSPARAAATALFLAVRCSRITTGPSRHTHGQPR